MKLIKSHKTYRPLVLAGIMAAMFMAAIEATIVATAMPSIVGELGGFSLFSWVFSAFLLTQAVTIPIYGKLADLYGRKPIFTFGVCIFLIGSILCGFAQSMNMLIIFRLIQGIGAGAVLPIATTIVGDIYNITERAKVQGYISSVWGVSSIIGPALGAVFVQYIHWSWVFWINLPIGLFAIFAITAFLHETVEKQKHAIDYLGSALLFVAISALMIVLIRAGVNWPWLSFPVIGLIILALLSIFLFLRQEKRAPEPVMPLGIWKSSLITVANLATLTTGVVMIGISSFLPTFVQGVMGKPPLIAGFALAVMSLGWPIAASIAGRLMLQIGYRKTAIIGGFWLLFGSVFFITLQAERSWLWAAAGSCLIGLGMGFTRTVFIVSIQNSVDWKARGVVTAVNMFMNILGNTLGATMLGGILNNRMSNYLKEVAPAVKNIPLDLDVTNTLLDPEKSKTIPSNVLEILKHGLTLALHNVYWGVAILALLSAMLVLFIPRNVQAVDNHQ